jgi:hypothetical protein
LGKFFAGHLAPDPRHGNRKVDRLGYIVVGAEFECAHDIFALAFGRGHQDGQVHGRASFANLGQHFVPALKRHHGVQQHGVEILLGN